MKRNIVWVSFNSLPKYKVYPQVFLPIVFESRKSKRCKNLHLHDLTQQKWIPHTHPPKPCGSLLGWVRPAFHLAIQKASFFLSVTLSSPRTLQCFAFSWQVERGRLDNHPLTIFITISAPYQCNIQLPFPAHWPELVMWPPCHFPTRRVGKKRLGEKPLSADTTWCSRKRWRIFSGQLTDCENSEQFVLGWTC